MPVSSDRPREVHAAGAVVFRKGGDVLVVHRPQYDDWSFPKGKLDRGEKVTVAAVREIGEETGLRVRLGPPLPRVTYPVRAGTKVVHYWVAWPIDDDDISGYVPNREIDEVRWVPAKKAARLLTYDFDRATLANAWPLRKRTRPLVVLRHAKARDRKAWRKDDRLRPLLKLGTVQAERLVPVLAAYDVESVVTSTSLRCVQTVSPYARAGRCAVVETPVLSEEEATAGEVLDLVDDLLHARDSVVVCSHRPVLPSVFDALGVPPVKLEPAAMVVVHRRKGRIVATELH